MPALPLKWNEMSMDGFSAHEWELGLIRDHPIRYSLSLLQMIVGLSAFLFGQKQMKRFQ